MAFDEAKIREELGLRAPKDGVGIVAKMSPGQPAAMAEAPQGVPVATGQQVATADAGVAQGVGEDAYGGTPIISQ